MDTTPEADPIRVLVIDDEVGLRDLMTYELGFRGFSVVTVASGEEAVVKARQERFDVVISDLTMPGMGGLESLGVIKGIDPRVEVIMATGYATLETAVEAMRRGACDYITKPFQIDDLCRLIERAAEKRRMGACLESGAEPRLPRRVLVVDDEDAVVTMLSDVLQAEGYEVDVADTGQGALGRMAANRPDLVFLDLMIPKLNGFDILEAMRRDPRLMGVPVVVLTGKRLTPQETNYLQKRVEKVVQKGLQDLPDLMSLVRDKMAALEGKRLD